MQAVAPSVDVRSGRTDPSIGSARAASRVPLLAASAACTTMPAARVESTSAWSDSSPVHSVSPTMNVRRSRSAKSTS